MPRVAQIIPFQLPDGRWRVSVPKTLSADGRRHKKIFAGATAAEKFAAKLRGAQASGVRGSLIPAVMAAEAAEAIRLLAGTGISLIEAARLAVGRVKTAAGAEVFSDRYDRAMLDGEMRWRHVYRLQMDRLPRWVPGWFMALPCGGIDRATMERALLEGGPKARSTLDMRMARISAIMGYHEKHRKNETIAILTAEQCTALLEACATPDEKWAVGLLLYAGIRPDAEQGEIARLDWSAVTAKEIVVSKEVSKVGERIVPMTAALRRTIKGHPKSGRVQPLSWKKNWQRIRKAAGVTGIDVTRHTFCSHMLAAYGMDKTQRAMGHVPLSQTTRRHYARAVSPADGKAYFR